MYLPNKRTVQVAGNLERFEGTRDERSPQTEESQDDMFEAFRFLLGGLGRERVVVLIETWGNLSYVDITTQFLRLRLNGGPGFRLEPLTGFGNDLLESFPQRL